MEITNNYKTISIVMCTYNGEKYLKEQLDSILKQSYPVYEIIIADDCSTDDTIHIIEHYKNKFDKIQYYKNTGHLDVNESFKNVLYKATGEYIIPCDQDDIWFENKIEKLLSALEQNKDKLLAVSQNQILYEDGSIDYTYKIIDPHISLALLLYKNCVSANACMFKRELLDYINTWQHTSELATDWRLALVAYALNRVC